MATVGDMSLWTTKGCCFTDTLLLFVYFSIRKLPSVGQDVCKVSKASLISLLDFNTVQRLFRINEAKVLNQEAI